MHSLSYLLVISTVASNIEEILFLVSLLFEALVDCCNPYTCLIFKLGGCQPQASTQLLEVYQYVHLIMYR